MPPRFSFGPLSSLPRQCSNSTTSTCSTQKSRDAKRRELPGNFVPGPTTVICGRGRECTSNAGNVRFRRITYSFLKAYSEARNKVEKSAIVTTIISQVKDGREDGVFCRFDNGVWWEVDDSVSREKVGCMLRDRLHAQYRSSSKSKLARKKAQMKKKETLGMQRDVARDFLDCFLPVSPKSTYFSAEKGLTSTNQLPEEETDHTDYVESKKRSPAKPVIVVTYCHDELARYASVLPMDEPQANFLTQCNIPDDISLGFECVPDDLSALLDNDDISGIFDI